VVAYGTKRERKRRALKSKGKLPRVQWRGVGAGSRAERNAAGKKTSCEEVDAAQTRQARGKGGCFSTGEKKKVPLVTT